MKRTITLSIIIFLFAGCQMVTTEEGQREYQIDSRVTEAVHTTTHALDIPVKWVCDSIGHVYGEASKIVGIEPKEVIDKTDKQLANEENWRVGAALAIAILTL